MGCGGAFGETLGRATVDADANGFGWTGGGCCGRRGVGTCFTTLTGVSFGDNCPECGDSLDGMFDIGLILSCETADDGNDPGKDEGIENDE